jgi:uncharacterized protein YjiS (DUF1127 family)
MKKQAQDAARTAGRATHAAAAGSGAPQDENRPLAERAGEPLPANVAGALKARLDQERRSVVDAGEPYPAIDHALLYAYEERGRRLHAQVSADILLSLFRKIGRMAKRVFLELPATWAERSRRYRELARLDDRLLQDMGLTRADIAYVSRYGVHPGHRLG